MNKSMKTLTAGVMMLGLAAAVPSLSAANVQDPQKWQEHIDTMEQAADELRATNPTLADKLQTLADEKREKLEEKQQS